MRQRDNLAAAVEAGKQAYREAVTSSNDAKHLTEGTLVPPEIDHERDHSALCHDGFRHHLRHRAVYSGGDAGGDL